jgi:cell division inhibitor SulA
MLLSQPSRPQLLLQPPLRPLSRQAYWALLSKLRL